MSAILLDTHAVVWWFLDSPRLSRRAGDRIESAIQNGAGVYVSVISIVEITYLVEKGKLPETALTLLEQALQGADSGLKVAPLSLEIAQQLRQTPRNIVPEMGDRMIAATALALGLPLISCDHKIQALTVIETIW